MTKLELMRLRALEALKHERWAEAAQIYVELLSEEQDHLKRGDDVTNLGAVLRKLGRLQDAFEHYRCWIQQFPSHTGLRLNAVNCVLDLGLLVQAEQWIEEGLQTDAENQGLIQAKGRLLLAQNRPELARRVIENLCRQASDQAGPWLDLSLVCHRLGDLEGALTASQQAAQLDHNHGGAWGNQISMLRELGRLTEADQLVKNLNPNIRQQPEVRRAVADLWMEQRMMAEAEAELETLCQLQPQEAGHWINRAACLRQLKHFLAAEAVLKTGLRWVPNDQTLQEALGHCMAEIGKGHRGMALLRRAFPWDETLSDASHASLQFLGAGYQLLEPAERQQLAKAWEQQKLRAGVGPLWADTVREPLEGRRLRLGYFSADLCNHPVGRFLLPLLKHHCHQTVEIWGLSCGPHSDEITREIQQYCDHWLNLRFGTDIEIARIMADQNLDVIVELGGFTGLSRISALLYKPAPVQLSYLGYPAPTYLNAIDGWIGDHCLFGTLPELDRQAQKLIMLEGGYMSYAENALPEPKRYNAKRFRFGSFNHSRKLSAEAVDLFCRVLAASNESELVLKSVSFIEAAERERVRKMFEKAGLAAERLITLPWVEGRLAHLDCYQQVDVALDPMPYGGATTTCEALIMGVPVVSLAGDSMVSRLSATVLEHSGCGQWIANSKDEYLQIASDLARNGQRDAAQRATLRDQITRSKLGDGKRLARAMESSLQAIAGGVLAAKR